MKAQLTHARIEQFSPVLGELLDAAEAQTEGRVRRPRKEVMTFLDAMTEVCMLLHCQLSGGPQPTRQDIVAIKQKLEPSRRRT